MLQRLATLPGQWWLLSLGMRARTTSSSSWTRTRWRRSKKRSKYWCKKSWNLGKPSRSRSMAKTIITRISRWAPYQFAHRWRRIWMQAITNWRMMKRWEERPDHRSKRRVAISRNKQRKMPNRGLAACQSHQASFSYRQAITKMIWTMH